MPVERLSILFFKKKALDNNMEIGAIKWMFLYSDFKINYYPWRILNLGFFLQMMYKRPLRFTILQSSLRFLMDAFTFISL